MFCRIDRTRVIIELENVVLDKFLVDTLFFLKGKKLIAKEIHTLDLYAQFCPILTNKLNKTIRENTEIF